MANKLSSIDLFSGCGGLSLGLEQAGFETIFVNELNADAMESFLMNRQHNPYLKEPANRAYDLLEITQKPEALKSLRKRLHSEFGDIDVVCGGPPCQGYSGIGHRSTFKELNTKKEAIPTNHLYKEMAKFIQELAPRAFIFENVRGLLSARKTAQGSPGEFWEDIQTEFKDIQAKPPKKNEALGYVVQWKLLLAKDYGVPQNRPRVIMIGIREDVHAQLPDSVKENTQDSFYPPKTNGAPDLIDVLGDLVDENHIRSGGSTTTYPKKADPKNKYQKELRRKTRNGVIPKQGDPLTEHDYSRHSPQVVRKFKRIHKSGQSLLGPQQEQLANERCRRYIEYKDPTYKNKILKERFIADFAPLLTETELEKIRLNEMNSSAKERTLFVRILDEVEKKIVAAMEEGSSKWTKLRAEDKDRIQHNLKKIHAKKDYQKKFSQRLLPERWDENGPNITVTGSTEDIIHFSQPRILTVREWARLQGFPDWYQFAGPRTTGGPRRAGDIDKVQRTLYIEILQEVAKEIQEKKTCQENSAWNNLSTEDKERIEHNLEKIKSMTNIEIKSGMKTTEKKQQEQKTNDKCKNYVKCKTPKSKNKILKERFLADFDPLLTETELMRIKKDVEEDLEKKAWARDLPKYTQIGNAVPVKLAFAIGVHIKDLLES